MVTTNGASHTAQSGGKGCVRRDSYGVVLHILAWDGMALSKHAPLGWCEDQIEPYDCPTAAGGERASQA